MANHFLEAVAPAVGCRRGFILLPKGCEGWGWSRFFGELSKVVAFFEAMSGPPLSSDFFWIGRRLRRLLVLGWGAP